MTARRTVSLASSTARRIPRPICEPIKVSVKRTSKRIGKIESETKVPKPKYGYRTSTAKIDRETNHKSRAIRGRYCSRNWRSEIRVTVATERIIRKKRIPTVTPVDGDL